MTGACGLAFVISMLSAGTDCPIIPLKGVRCVMGVPDSDPPPPTA